MEIKTFELKGWVYVHDEDIFLEAVKTEDYYYPSSHSIGELVTDHFKALSKSFDVSYENWQRGEFLAYKDVFVRYYVSDTEVTWDEINEEHIKKMVGGLDTEKRYDGYSEWTITDSWVDIFVGGHNLREEMKTYKDKYVLIKIDYKV